MTARATLRVHVARLVAPVAVAASLLAFLAAALAGVLGRTTVAVAALSAGAGLAVAGFAVVARRLLRLAVKPAAMPDASGLVERLALRSLAGEAKRSRVALRRLAEEAGSGVRLALAQRLPRETDGFPGADRGLLVAILGLAPQRVVLAGGAHELAAHTEALADLAPSLTVLALPAPEHHGAFFGQLADEGRDRNAPIPVVAATGADALADFLRDGGARHLLERHHVDHMLVLAPSSARSVLRGLELGALRVVPVGAAALLVSWTRSVEP